MNLLEVPDPRHVAKGVAGELQNAFAQLCRRETHHLVEQEFLGCQSSVRVRKLAEWLAAQTAASQRCVIPEDKPSIPDASDFLDASTVFFRQSNGGKPASLPLPSRSHAEMVFTLARLGLHGAIRLPDDERAARELKRELDARLAAIFEKAHRLAHSRTGDERRAADVSGLLQHWMTHGKPTQTVKQSELDSSAAT